MVPTKQLNTRMPEGIRAIITTYAEEIAGSESQALRLIVLDWANKLRSDIKEKAKTSAAPPATNQLSFPDVEPEPSVEELRAQLDMERNAHAVTAAALERTMEERERPRSEEQGPESISRDEPAQPSAPREEPPQPTPAASEPTASPPAPAKKPKPTPKPKARPAKARAAKRPAPVKPRAVSRARPEARRPTRDRRRADS